MDYIKILREVQNNLKELSNSNNLDLVNIENEFNRLQRCQNDLDDELIELDEEANQRILLTIETLLGAIIGTVITIKEEFNFIGIYILYSIFIYNLTTCIMIYLKRESSYQMFDDLDYEMTKSIYNTSDISRNKNKIDNEINKLDIAIDFLNSLTEEEAKCLKLKI